MDEYRREQILWFAVQLLKNDRLAYRDRHSYVL